MMTGMIIGYLTVIPCRRAAYRRHVGFEPIKQVRNPCRRRPDTAVGRSITDSHFAIDLDPAAGKDDLVEIAEAPVVRFPLDDPLVGTV